MRYLDRSAVPAPTCLARLDPNIHRWDMTDVSWSAREEIRDQLGILQKTHCAYCECDLSRESNNPHIEHFEQRRRVQAKTFDWGNLFWSCTHSERCGKNKDRLVRTYQPADLLKPDVDDPRLFLFFGADGEVSPRGALTGRDHHRAKETIRVFALDHGTLVTMRKAYLAAPYAALQDIEQAGFTAEEAVEFMQQTAKDYEDSPFSAAILDLLGLAL